MRTKYVITPEMDGQIRRLYQEKVGMGSAYHGDSPVKDLAKRLGIPRQKITRHAIHSGYVHKTAKQPNWSDEELGILERHAQKQPEAIRRHLKKAGYARSVTAIVVKRKRMRFTGKNLNGQSATSLALCFGVDYKTIKRWIDKGYLKARKRGTKRTPQQGGDMYYVKDKWVKDFIVGNVDVIDIRKINKYWLVDILAGKL